MVAQTDVSVNAFGKILSRAGGELRFLSSHLLGLTMRLMGIL